MPLPVAEAPVVIVSQDALDVAVQAKSVAFEVTATVRPVTPAPTAVSDDGESETLPARPLCVTVSVWPPIVRVPVRLLMLGLAATL